MKKKIILMYILSAFAFIACSEDSGTNDTSKTYENYFPMNIGDYIITDVYGLDSDENRLEMVRSGDSLVYTHEEMYGDKNCKILTSYGSDGHINYFLSFHKNGNEIWVHPYRWKASVQWYKYMWGDFPLEPDSNELWRLIDFSQDSWDGGMEKKQEENYYINDSTRMDLSINYFGEKIRDYKFEFGGKSYDAIEFKTTFTAKCTTFINGEEFKKEGSHIEKYVFADGLGWVSYKSLPFIVDFGFGPIPIPGEESVTTDFYAE